MKHFFIALVVILSLTSSVRAQDTARSTISRLWLNDSNTTRFERVGYVVGSTLAFSLLDYIAYNIVSPIPAGPAHNRAILGLHVFDGVIGAAITYFLYKTLGLPSTIAFDLTWWSWGNDLEFYGWGYSLNPSGPWLNRSNIALRGHDVNWAGWTPIGLLRPQGSWIASDALIAQAIIGFSISMALLW